ncbi:MAG: hypothetical protein WEE64_02995 [Dehalococcoidia bacterium]
MLADERLPAKERPQVGLALSPRIAPLLTIVAAALAVAGFFLPWMNGAGPFDLRSFSGFDFARLVRNFEITADSASSSAQVRGTAVALYLVPALALNAAVLHAAAPLLGLQRRLVGWALLVSGAYALAILGLLLLLSLAPLNDFQSSVGLPSWGFALSAASGALLVWLGRRELSQQKELDRA